MDTEFGLMDNLMDQMIGDISQILNISKVEPNTPTTTESIRGPQKAEFMHAMN